jgi:hypothetical protein
VVLGTAGRVGDRVPGGSSLCAYMKRVPETTKARFPSPLTRPTSLEMLQNLAVSMRLSGRSASHEGRRKIARRHYVWYLSLLHETRSECYPRAGRQTYRG